MKYEDLTAGEQYLHDHPSVSRSGEYERVMRKLSIPDVLCNPAFEEYVLDYA